MCRALVAFLALVSLLSCAKPDLPDLKIRAADPSEFSSFMTDLERRFSNDRLESLETALTELQWDAMHRGIKTAADREQDMLAKINGKTVREAQILGWQVRRERLQREIATMTDIRDHNKRLAGKTAATGTPESVLTHLHNAEDILARQKRELAATEHQLLQWSLAPGGR